MFLLISHLSALLRSFELWSFDELLFVSGGIVEVLGDKVSILATEVLSKDEIKVVITLGAVIKGETDHYHYISEAVTNGIMKITLESKIPIIFGVLTCQTLELAQKRSSIQNMSCNKGYEAGQAALSMINTKK